MRTKINAVTSESMGTSITRPIHCQQTTKTAITGQQTTSHTVMYTDIRVIPTRKRQVVDALAEEPKKGVASCEKRRVGAGSLRSVDPRIGIRLMSKKHG